MHTINAFKAGWAIGIVMGLWHLCWAGLVAAGWAQAVIDFILGLHFIKLGVEIQPFNLATAAALVAVTTLIGFVVGFVLATAWNWLRRESAA